MFELGLKPEAMRQLRKLKRHHAVRILDALERHLRHEPEKPSRSRIKKLRGRQKSTYRLRVGDYRVFYDVLEEEVQVVAILHKRETAGFYEEDQMP